MVESVDKLCQALGYRFNNPDLLDLALTHRSVGQKNNERLEYLGDALLGFVIADRLFHRFLDVDEGDLTRLRARLVKKDTLALLARKLDLGDYIKLGSGELKSGGWRRDSILANTFEAIIGAIYLDSGFEGCRDCLLNLYQELLEEVSATEQTKDPKTLLQEYLQARKLSLPTYTTIKEEGEPHTRKFTVQCEVEPITDAIIATGKSKRLAEQSSAELALSLLESKVP